MRERIDRKMRQCPECGAYFYPEDDEEVCEVCSPESYYARRAGYENHPFQPQRIDDMTDCEDE